MTRLTKLGLKFLTHRFRKLHPFEVQASLLNACDLRCQYCRCPEIRETGMSTTQWTDAIRGLAALGASRIKFQGGEPTLRKDFRELCRVTQEAGVTSSVTTNGQKMAVEPELFDYLDEVVFSLDALDPEKNDRQRGQGVHRNIMRAIDYAAQKGVRIFINTVVSRITLDEVRPMMEFCQQRGIGFNAQPVQADWSYSDPEIRELLLEDGEIRELNRNLAQWKREGYPVMFCAETYERSAVWPDYGSFQEHGEQTSKCMAGRYYFHIEPNGDVYPCGLNVGKTPVKNIVEHGLHAALEAAKHHHCIDCGMAYLNERKALFGLKPFAVREMIRRSAR